MRAKLNISLPQLLRKPRLRRNNRRAGQRDDNSEGWLAKTMPSLLSAFVGGAIAASSSYFIFQMQSREQLVQFQRQTKAQLEQLLFDRKITVLKDYAESNSRLSASLLAKVHQTLTKLAYAKQYGSTPNEQADIARLLFEAIPDAETWRTNVEGQRALAYAVFGVRYPQEKPAQMSTSDFQQYLNKTLTDVKQR
ncbi:MAG: hypothetical protein ACREAC_11395, partial [Blastocatellia bacterium]